VRPVGGRTLRDRTEDGRQAIFAAFSHFMDKL
jgi:hypothetical protein